MLSNSHISGYYDTKLIGSNYSGNVSGLGFTALVRTFSSDGEESTRLILVPLIEANFSIPKFTSKNKNIAPMDQVLASQFFKMSYNNAVDEMNNLLRSGLAPRLQTISEFELRKDFINLIKSNLIWLGGDFNAYYVNGAASNTIQPYIK